MLMASSRDELPWLPYPSAGPETLSVSVGSRQSTRRTGFALLASTIGRPRALTDAQVADVLAWHRSHKSLTQVAREYAQLSGPRNLSVLTDSAGRFL